MIRADSQYLRWLSGFIAACGLIVCLLIIAMTVHSRHADWQSEVKIMHRKADLLARVYSQQVERILRQADLTARLAAQRYLDEGDKLDLRRLAQSGALPLDIFPAIAVMDGRGVLRASTIADFARVDFSDREHVAVHMRPDGPAHYISTPAIGRVTGLPLVYYSKPIRDDLGNLLGIAVVALDPKHFNSYFETFDLGAEGVLAVIGTDDGVFRSRQSAREMTGLTQLPDDAPVLGSLRRGLSGVVQTRSLIDGYERLFGFRRVGDYPIGVTVGLDINSHQAQVAKRSREQWWNAGLAIALTAALSAVSAYLAQRQLVRNQQRAKERVQREQLQRRLAGVVEAAPDGILLLDADQTVRAANSAFKRAAGLGEGDPLIGEPFREALRVLCAHQQMEPPEAARWSQIWAAEPRVDGGHRVLLRRERSPRVSFDVRAWPLAESDGYVVSVRDITAEYEIDRLKLEFVTTAAHELRTPMASVLGFSELLVSDHLDADERREAQQLIHRQAARLTSLLNDFLDLARIEARAGLELRREKLDLVAIVAAVVNEFSYMNQDRITRFDHDGQLFVYGDQTTLTQAIQNLVSNALKYSASPSHVVVRLACDHERSLALLEVEDRGIGMTPVQLEHAFQAFYRGDESGKTTGSGLGLPLAKRIIEAHHGTIEIESEFCNGTRVKVAVPLYVQAEVPDEVAVA